jgi:protein TonB
VVEEPKIEPPRFGVAYLNNPAPAYPPISRRLGEQGRVMLKVLVSAAGEPQSVALETGSGSDRLDQAAIEAVKQWRFVPAKRNGQSLSAYVLVPLKFVLRG